MYTPVIISIVTCFISLFDGSTGAVFDFESSDFETISKTSAFLDKTLFIKEILETNEVSLITAPHKYGKSTNMNMLKRFLELEVNKEGHPKTRANFLSEPVKDTDNYKFFLDNAFKITENFTLVNEHLGRTPVISVSFKCGEVIRSLDDALSFYKTVVHKVFKQHQYLVTSSQLTVEQKQYIETWCDEREYRMFGQHRVTASLRELSGYLSHHFGDKKVFVLIDDHDDVIKNAMIHVASADVVDDIVRVTVFIMNAVLKNNSKYVQGGLVTGVFDIPVFGSAVNAVSDPEAFIKYKFLGNHKFVDFYGFTKEEVDEVFEYPELKLGEAVVKEARERYGGFRNKIGREMFNMFSILHFVKTGSVENYWTKQNNIVNISSILKVPELEESITDLFSGRPTNITVSDMLTVDDIVKRRDLMRNPQSPPEDIDDTFISLLLEEGYLSYGGEAGLQQGKDELWSLWTTVKIPNKEIMEYLVASKNWVKMNSI